MERIFRVIESDVTDETTNEIIEYWNSFGIFKKNLGTEKKTKQLKRMLSKYDISEFKTYIDRYAQITNDSDYFFKYRWDLVTFATHKDTKERFCDEGTLWIPYLDWKNKKVKVCEKTEPSYLDLPMYNDTLKQLKEMTYNDYLQTEHWKYFIGRVKNYYGNKCMVCNSSKTQLDVHHKTYENRGREMYDDVIVLCHSCHTKFHDK